MLDYTGNLNQKYLQVTSGWITPFTSIYEFISQILNNAKFF